MSVRKPPSLRTRQINQRDASPLSPTTPLCAETPPETQRSDHVIRDTFSMPQVDYQLIAQLQHDCLQQGMAVNKSELVRAGLKTLAALDQAALAQAVAQVDKIKVGRRKRTGGTE